jgi:hypothetical protein
MIHNPVQKGASKGYLKVPIKPHQSLCRQRHTLLKDDQTLRYLGGMITRWGSPLHCFFTKLYTQRSRTPSLPKRKQKLYKAGEPPTCKEELPYQSPRAISAFRGGCGRTVVSRGDCRNLLAFVRPNCLE